MKIVKAEHSDLPRILELQYLAYQSEAVLVGSTDIPPLKQTLEELAREYEAGLILKAKDEQGRIIGSVRGRIRNGALHVGRLIVRPEQQGKGLGTALLAEIERLCPRPRCELFTSSRSLRNIRLYERCGYKRFREETVSPGLTMVFLEKRTIRLRGFTDGDIARLKAWLFLDHVSPWYHQPDEWLREVADREGEFRFLHHFIAVHGERPVGFGQYYDCFDAGEAWYRVDRPGSTYSMDYLIGEEEYLMKGFGGEIVGMLTGQIAAIPGAERIIVQPEQDNAPSCGALRANGFRYDDRLAYFVREL